MWKAPWWLLLLVAVSSFVCGVGAMQRYSAWENRNQTSCDALLSRFGIPNPFQLTGNNCAVMDVSNNREAAFEPGSVANWKTVGHGVKVLGRGGNKVVVQDCPTCETNWIGWEGGKALLRYAPEVK